MRHGYEAWPLPDGSIGSRGWEDGQRRVHIREHIREGSHCRAHWFLLLCGGSLQMRMEVCMEMCMEMCMEVCMEVCMEMCMEW